MPVLECRSLTKSTLREQIMGKTDVQKPLYMPESLASRLEKAASQNNEFPNSEVEIIRQALWDKLEDVNASPTARKNELRQEIEGLQEEVENEKKTLEQKQELIEQKKQELDEIEELIEEEGTNVRAGTYEEALASLAREILSQDKNTEMINISSNQARVERVAENHGRKPMQVLRDLYEKRVELVEDDFWADEIRFKVEDWEREWPDEYSEALERVALRKRLMDSRTNLREFADEFDKDSDKVNADLADEYPDLA